MVKDRRVAPASVRPSWMEETSRKRTMHPPAGIGATATLYGTPFGLLLIAAE